MLLKGEWHQAVSLILSPHADDREDNAAARRLYTEGGDITGALKALPRHLTAEHALLQARAMSINSLHCCRAWPAEIDVQYAC